LAGDDVEFLVDTGATRSYVKPSKNLKGVSKINKNFIAESIHGKSVISEKCTLNLFNQNAVFYLLPDLKSYDGIIGFELLKRVNANIDLKLDRLNFDGGFLKIFYSKCREIHFLKVIHDDIPHEIRETFLHAIETRAKVFADPNEKLPYNTNVVAAIRTTDNDPVYVKSYPYPLAVSDFVNREIDSWLRNGIIRESRSPYNNPLWVVDKKGTDEFGDKNYRLVNDFKKLNAKTISDRYPIPDISVILSNLGKSEYFTTLDLKSGFHQISLKEEDREKTAFSINNGKFEYCRLAFGLKNAPAIFQRAIDDVLRPLIGKVCHVYVDDVIIFSKTSEQHVKDILAVLDRLYEANMRVSAEKSKFFRTEVEYLGFVVSAKGIKTCPKKINAIVNFEQPKSLRALRSFLGLAGYYRRFVRDYAQIAKPLTKLLRGSNGTVTAKQSKKVPIQFDEEATEAFLKIKNILASEEILLLYPDYKKTFDLTTDASSAAIGAVLSQDGKPITMISRTLSKAEENYAVNERELLAIVWAFRKLRNYLYGATKINIHTDHQPLVFSLSEKNPNTKMKRWRSFIEEFSPRFIYKPGRENVVADALSRQHINALASSSCVNSELSSTPVIPSVINPLNCFKNQIVLISDNSTKKSTKILFKSRVRHTIHFESLDTLFNIIPDVVNPNVVNAIHCELPILGQIQSKLIALFPSVKFRFAKNLVIDIFNTDDQREILLAEHNRAHRSLRENMTQILRDYFFPNMRNLLKEIISTCKICKQAKYARHPIRQQIGKSPIPKFPGEILHVDIFSTDKKHFLTCIDKFSKFAIVNLIASRSIVDVKNSLLKALNFFHNISTIVCDNEKSLNSETIKSLLKNHFNAKVFAIPAAHSSSNGQVERFHSTLAEISRCIKMENEVIDTEELIMLATIKYNRSVHSVTGKLPVEILSSLSPSDRREIRRKLEEAQVEELYFHNKGRQNRTFEPGDKVFIKTNRRIGNKFRKLYLEKQIQEDLGNSVLIENRKVHKDNIR